jgi:hypothetical protein
MHAPALYGDAELLHDVGYLESVDALEDVLVAQIPASDYEAFLRGHPDAMFEHLCHVTAAFCVVARSEQQLFASMEERIANLLLSYSDLYGEITEEGEIEIAHPLTQERIALSLGTLRRSVAGVLSRWRKQQVVSRKGKHWVIHKPETLENLAVSIRDGLSYQIGMPLSHLKQSPGLPLAEVAVTRGPARCLGRSSEVEGSIVVGSQPPADFVLPDETISPQQCRIFRSSSGRRYWVEDLKAVNQTCVNDKPVNRAVLRDGDHIQVGRVELTLRLRARPAVSSDDDSASG